MKSPKKTETAKPWSFKKRVLLAVSAMALLGIGYFIYFINSPSDADIKVANVESPVESSAASYLPLETPYFKLLYPGDYSLSAAQTAAPQIVSFKGAAADTTPDKPQDLEISLKTAPYGGIVLDGDYRTYLAQPKQYQLSRRFFGAEIVDVAARISGNEVNALWLHGKYILVIKLRAQLEPKDLDQRLQDMLSSVQWQP